MAIQMRRGANSDFNPSKMLPGEIAVTTDGSRKVYAAFKANDVKELASKEDVQGLMNEFTSEVDREIAEAEQRIESKGQQVLDTIPDMYEEVSARADEAVRTKADAIVCSAKGVDILVEDSSNDYLRNLKLYGKTTQGENPTPNNPQPLESVGKWGNLLENTLKTQTLNGGTLTVNEDKSVTLNGTFTANTQFTFISSIPNIKDRYSNLVLISGSYTGTIQHTEFDANYNYGGNNYTVDMPFKMYDGAEYVYFRISVTSGTVCNNLKLGYVVSLENYNSYRPYTGQLEIESVIGTTNFLDYEEWKKTPVVNGTGVYENNGVTLTSKETKDCYTMFQPNYAGVYKLPCVAGKNYVLSWEHSGSHGLVYIFPNGLMDGMLAMNTQHANYLEYMPTEGITFFTFRFGVTEANSTAIYKNIQINIGKKREFTPYSKQSHISLVGNGLKGIPVTDASLATYTDENGQMWCSDYVDCERGVLVQRIRKKNLADVTKWYSVGGKNTTAFLINGFLDNIIPIIGFSTVANIMCNRLTIEMPDRIASGTLNTIGQGNNRVLYVSIDGITASDNLVSYFAENETILYYILAEPIETPLSADEIASYKALKSNYKVTSVMNDCGAFMEVKYNSDTKLYIDNKFTELAEKLLA